MGGKGVWVFPNGNQLTGEYEQKEIAGEDAPPCRRRGRGCSKEGSSSRVHLQVLQLCLCKGRCPSQANEVHADEDLSAAIWVPVDRNIRLSGDHLDARFVVPAQPGSGGDVCFMHACLTVTLI